MQVLRDSGVLSYLLILLTLSITIPSISIAKDVVENYDHDVEWLAYNIYHEARGEDFIGKVTVALVTINRVESNRFPNSIHDVITQPAQFSWYWDDKPDLPQEPKAYKACFAVSKMVISLWKDGYIEDLVRQLHLDKVKWYHNLDASPKWKNNYQFVAKVGRHLVYKDQE